MDFFMKKENVEQYTEMIKEYDPTWIIGQVRCYLKDGSTLLELGMGTGKDLVELNKYYNVIGTDNSPIFIEEFNKKKTGIEVLCVDAVEMNINQTFDCIYSNKVLQHLTKEDFIKSLHNQHNKLNPHGIIIMTLWRGEGEEIMEMNGKIRFTYYLEDQIKEIIKYEYTILCLEPYTEMDENDSLFVVLRKK